MKQKPLVFWFRQDLRLHDHPALRVALDSGRPVLPVYVWDRNAENFWKRVCMRWRGKLPGGVDVCWFYLQTQAKRFDPDGNFVRRWGKVKTPGFQK